MIGGAGRLGATRSVAARVLAAWLLLFAQILGASLAGASLGLPSRVELCVGTGDPLAVTLPAPGLSGDDEPIGHRHELCPGCLACPLKSPVPAVLPLPVPGPAVALEPPRPAPDAPPPALERTLRPPGRALPSLS